MAMGNQSLPIIAKALGHKTIAATQIYSRLMADPVRAAMESAQSDMANAMNLLESSPTIKKPADKTAEIELLLAFYG
jgi:site-specific recombinase XerC